MTTQLPEMSLQNLYDRDYVRWLDLTVENLRQRNLINLDWEHLIEEIEALGNEQRRKVESYLKQLLIHLLLYKYWEQERSYCDRGWENEIDNFRDELEFLLRSKTLYNYCSQQVSQVYIKARKQAIKKSNLAPEIFPEQCPFKLEEILNSDYLPNL
jgi:Domain of unknown function DUF29